MSARIFGHYCAAEAIALFSLEALAMVGAIGFTLIAIALDHAAARPSLLAQGVGVLLAFELSLYVCDLHDIGTATSDGRRGGRLLRAIGGAAAAVGLCAWVRPMPSGRGLDLLVVAVAAASVILARWLYLARLRRPRRVLLVGSGARAAAIHRAVEGDLGGRFTIVDQWEDPRLEDLSRGLSLSQADVVVVASDDRRGLSPTALLAARLRGIAVLEAAQFIERVERRIPLELIRPGDLAFAEGPVWNRTRKALKRGFDLLAGSLLLVFAAPVMCLVALAVRMGSKGPVFYRQERLGRDGKPYTLVKFRTMRVDAELATGPVWAQQRDPRVTRVGAFLRRARLDELPQLFNVLEGSMSLVGPRPERDFFAAQVRAKVPLFDLRLAAKPGVTGWAQLRYPYGASIEDARAKLELDLYYLKNGSPFLDLVIAFHTAKHVLLGRGSR
ncbi:MAG TPA: exopolysaccharide biosynthesis polyprenyl glycosylphosphotransferase [Myxococcales bacterium]|nr:exopolysaccharide biosynthesis polyprenyl glycosylphosphotransferase [Myxococcales bacterium]